MYVNLFYFLSVCMEPQQQQQHITSFSIFMLQHIFAVLIDTVILVSPFLVTRYVLYISLDVAYYKTELHHMQPLNSVLGIAVL